MKNFFVGAPKSWERERKKGFHFSSRNGTTIASRLSWRETLLASSTRLTRGQLQRGPIKLQISRVFYFRVGAGRGAQEGRSSKDLSSLRSSRHFGHLKRAPTIHVNYVKPDGLRSCRNTTSKSYTVPESRTPRPMPCLDARTTQTLEIPWNKS